MQRPATPHQNTHSSPFARNQQSPASPAGLSLPTGGCCWGRHMNKPSNTAQHPLPPPVLTKLYPHLAPAARQHQQQHLLSRLLQANRRVLLEHHPAAQQAAHTNSSRSSPKPKPLQVLTTVAPPTLYTGQLWPALMSTPTSPAALRHLTARGLLTNQPSHPGSQQQPLQPLHLPHTPRHAPQQKLCSQLLLEGHHRPYTAPTSQALKQQ